MLLVVFHTFAAFGDGWDVAGGDPPETVDGLVQLDEPLGAVAKDADVVGAIDVVAERFERIPDGHIDEHCGIVVVDDIGGIAGRGLEAPDEAGGAVCEGVDRLKLIDEFSDLGVADRSNEPANVDLGEMKFGHGSPYCFERAARVYRGSDDAQDAMVSPSAVRGQALVIS